MYYEKFLKNNQNFQNKRFQSSGLQPYNSPLTSTLQRTPPNNKSHLNMKYDDLYNNNQNLNINSQRKSEDIHTKTISFNRNGRINNNQYATENTGYTSQFNINNFYGNSPNPVNINQNKNSSTEHLNPGLLKKKDFIKSKQTLDFKQKIRQSPSSYPSLSFFQKNQKNQQKQKNSDKSHLRSTFGQNLQIMSNKNIQLDNLTFKRQNNQKKYSYNQGPFIWTIENKQPYNINTNNNTNNNNNNNNNTNTNTNNQQINYLLITGENKNIPKNCQNKHASSKDNVEIQEISIKQQNNKQQSFSVSPSTLTDKQIKMENQNKQFGLLPKNVYKNSQPILNEKQNYFINKNILKSPSDNNLLIRKSNSIRQQLKEDIQLGLHPHTQIKYTGISNKAIPNDITNNEQSQNKQKSLKYIPNPYPSHNNYHATLFQNLEKKFTEQKKSSQSFQVKQKTYQNELMKKNEKIKRLQTIIDNNRQTMVILQDTIKQMQKKLQNKQNQSALDSPIVLNLQIDSLKKQNIRIKDENKNKKNQCLNMQDKYNSIEQIANNLITNELKLKDNQAKLQQDLRQQTAQINKLKQTNNNLNAQNCMLKNQSQQYQREIQQLKKLKQSKNISGSTQNSKIIKQNQTILQQVQQLKKIKESMNVLSEQNFKILKKNQLLSKQVQILQQKQTKYVKTINNLQQNIDLLKNNQYVGKHQNSELRKSLQNIQNQLIDSKRQNELKLSNLMIKIKIQQSTKPEQSQQQYKQTIHNLKNQIQIIKSQIKKYQHLLNQYHQKFIQIAFILKLDICKKQLKEPDQSSLEVLYVLLKTQLEKNYKQLQNNYKQLQKNFKQQKQIKKSVLSSNLPVSIDTESVKTQKIHDMQKSLKKQGAKINSLSIQNNQKNYAIWDLNKMQLQAQIRKLNEKYQILNVNILGICQN